MKNSEFKHLKTKELIKELRKIIRDKHHQELELEGFREMILAMVNQRVASGIHEVLEQLTDTQLATLLHEVDAQMPEEQIRFVSEADLDEFH